MRSHIWAGTQVEAQPREPGMRGGAPENCLIGLESQEGPGSQGEDRVSYGRS